MKGLEAAIRKALNGAGGAEPPQRERIYAAARKALAKSLEGQGITGSQRARAQTDALDAFIDTIEGEYWAEPPPPDLGFGDEPMEPDYAAESQADFAVPPPQADAAAPPPQAEATEPPLRRSAPSANPADVAEDIFAELHGGNELPPEWPISASPEADFVMPDTGPDTGPEPAPDPADMARPPRAARPRPSAAARADRRDPPPPATDAAVDYDALFGPVPEKTDTERPDAEAFHVDPADADPPVADAAPPDAAVDYDALIDPVPEETDTGRSDAEAFTIDPVDADPPAADAASSDGVIDHDALIDPAPEETDAVRPKTTAFDVDPATGDPVDAATPTSDASPADAAVDHDASREPDAPLPQTEPVDADPPAADAAASDGVIDHDALIDPAPEETDSVRPKTTAFDVDPATSDPFDAATPASDSSPSDAAVDHDALHDPEPPRKADVPFPETEPFDVDPVTGDPIVAGPHIAEDTAPDAAADRYELLEPEPPRKTDSPPPKTQAFDVDPAMEDPAGAEPPAADATAPDSVTGRDERIETKPRRADAARPKAGAFSIDPVIIDPIGMETPAADSKPPDVAIERDGLFGFGSRKSRASRPKGAAIDIDPVTKEPAGAGPMPIDPVSEAVRETRSKRDLQHGDAPQIEPADAPRKPPREDGGDTARAEEGAPAEKRKRPVFSMILVAALAIAFVGIGAVWAMVSGILQTPEQRDTSVPNPPAIVESEDFAGGLSVDGAFSSEWIEMFAPRDMESAIPGARAAIERVESAGGGAVRITSADPGLSGEVLFELEPALLRRLDGRPSLIALTARSAGEMPTQITVRCALPGGNGCGRYRFDVAYAAGDIVFRLDEIGDATQPGFLAVNADVTGNGGAIDLYGIRILRQ